MLIIWKSNVENTQTYWSSQSAIHADMEVGTTHNCGVHSHGIFSECIKFLQACGCNILNSIIWPGDFNSEAQFVLSETWLKKTLYEMCILQYLDKFGTMWAKPLHPHLGLHKLVIWLSKLLFYKGKYV